MKQIDLDFESERESQRREKLRVRSKIGAAVLAFCRAHPTFRCEELRRYVAEQFPTAPASADRILRDLRQSGRVEYVVTNRRQSEYRVVKVEN